MYILLKVRRGGIYYPLINKNQSTTQSVGVCRLVILMRRRLTMDNPYFLKKLTFEGLIM